MGQVASWLRGESGFRRGLSTAGVKCESGGRPLVLYALLQQRGLHPWEKNRSLAFVGQKTESWLISQEPCLGPGGPKMGDGGQSPSDVWNFISKP